MFLYWGTALSPFTAVLREIHNLHLGQNTDISFSRLRLLFNSLPESTRFQLNLKIRRGKLNLYNLFHIFADNIQSADLSKTFGTCAFLSIY